MNSRFAPPDPKKDPTGDTYLPAVVVPDSNSRRGSQAPQSLPRMKYLPVKSRHGWAKVAVAVLSIAVAILFMSTSLWALLTHNDRFFDDWGFGLLFFSPLIIWGLIYAPSNLRWGLKNPPVQLNPQGITYCHTPHWHPTLVPWECFRGAETVHGNNKDAISRVSGWRILSGPPYAYGLAVHPKGLKVRRPSRAARVSAGSLQIPLSDDPDDLAAVAKAINDYHRAWQKLPESARMPVVPRGKGSAASSQEQLAGIISKVGTSPLDPLILGQSRIVLQEPRWPKLWRFLGWCLGVALCVMLILVSIREPLDWQDEEVTAGFVVSVLAVLVCLWFAGLNAFRLFAPPSLILDSKGFTRRPHPFDGGTFFNWEKVESVRPEGRVWSVFLGKSSLSAIRCHNLKASTHLSAEEVGILVSAYYDAWSKTAAKNEL